MEDLPISPLYLFIYSIIYLYQDGLVQIYFILWFILQYYFICYVALIVSLWLFILSFSSCVNLTPSLY